MSRKRKNTSSYNKRINNLDFKEIKKNDNFFNNSLFSEVLSILFLAISFFLIICIFFESGGFIGKFLNNTLKIFFGIGSYFIPFIIFFINIYKIIKKKNEISKSNFIISSSIFILILTLLNILLFSFSLEKFTNISYFFEKCKTRFGIISEILSMLFLKLFGKLGSSTIIITSLLVFIIILTKKSFIEFIKSYKNKIHKKNFSFGKNNLSKNNVNNSIQINGIEDDFADNLIKNDFNKKDSLEKNECNIKNNITKDDVLEKNKKDFFTNIELYKNSKEIGYTPPSIDLLAINKNFKQKNSKSEILENSTKLEETLKSFGVDAKVIEVSKGPTVTRYEISPGQGVKVSKISNLADDLALNLAAKGIRIEAPIPGKAAVGIEIPNKETYPVYLREVLEDKEFQNFSSNLAFGLGKDISGKVIITDICKMPHLLIAGATGSGKSVCINTLITSLLYKSSPNEVKLIMIDPKVVELSIYNGIPHLMIPVVTDPKNAASALNWAVREMLRRYELFAKTNVRDLEGYNKSNLKEENISLPQIVIIIDELSDLMMAAPSEVEDSICRLAQMARAAGLHLIIATQRPSVDVITGIIKANIPSRLAFSVSSGVDSRTILDMTGAEKLLGHGDMLFYPSGMNKPIRIQGAYISDKEVESIVSFLKKNHKEKYDEETIKDITSNQNISSNCKDDEDELFDSVVEFIIEKEKASASLLQRQFRIGFNKAARLIESLEKRNFISSENSTKPRKVLITKDQWLEINKNNKL